MLENGGIFLLIEDILKKMNLKYTIRKNKYDNNIEYISLKFEKVDPYDNLVHYSVLIFLDEFLGTVSIVIPSINPILSDDLDLDIELLEEKIEFLNHKGVYGHLTLDKKLIEVSYKYNFVYIPKEKYLQLVLHELFIYMDFIVYEAGVLLSEGVNFENIIEIRKNLEQA